MKSSVSINILCDAMGWELISRYEFLKDLLPYRYRVRTILGYSSAALPSIYTGLSPSQHGHWSMWYYNPGTSPFRKIKMLCRIPQITIRGRNLNRGLIARCYQRFAGITNYHCIYDIPLEHLYNFDLSGYRDIYLPGAFDGIESIFDVLHTAMVPHLVLSWKTPLPVAFQKLIDDIYTRQNDFYFLYLADLDALLHAGGTHRSENILPFLQNLERQVMEVSHAAHKNYHEVRLYLFSDHGMCNVTETIDLWSLVRKLPLREFRDYVPFYDSTMARFYTLSKSARDILLPFLSSLSAGSVLSEEEIKKCGAYFPDNKFGDIIFLLHPGKLINPSFMGTNPPMAMHGYHPDDKDSFAAFLSNREIAVPLDSICDFYAVMKKDVARLVSAAE